MKNAITAQNIMKFLMLAIGTLLIVGACSTPEQRFPLSDVATPLAVDTTTTPVAAGSTSSSSDAHRVESEQTFQSPAVPVEPVSGATPAGAPSPEEREKLLNQVNQAPKHPITEQTVTPPAPGTESVPGSSPAK